MQPSDQVHLKTDRIKISTNQKVLPAFWNKGNKSVTRNMHLNVCKDQETLSQLRQRDNFKNFREGLKASGPESPPQSEGLEYVGSSIDFY